MSELKMTDKLLPPEPSDEQIKQAIDAIDFGQMVTADDYPYMIARAVLALRSQPVQASEFNPLEHEQTK